MWASAAAFIRRTAAAQPRCTAALQDARPISAQLAATTGKWCRGAEPKLWKAAVQPGCAVLWRLVRLQPATTAGRAAARRRSHCCPGCHRHVAPLVGATTAPPTAPNPDWCCGGCTVQCPNKQTDRGRWRQQYSDAQLQCALWRQAHAQSQAAAGGTAQPTRCPGRAAGSGAAGAWPPQQGMRPATGGAGSTPIVAGSSSRGSAASSCMPGSSVSIATHSQPHQPNERLPSPPPARHPRRPAPATQPVRLSSRPAAAHRRASR